MPHQGLTWKVFFLIVLTDMGNSAAQLLMKMGMLHPAGDSISLTTLLHFFSGNVFSPLIWAGILIYVLSFFTWIIVLSKIDLSMAIPLATTDYIIIPLLAIFFLGEYVSLLRWLGIAAIVSGIFFVSQSGKETLPVGGDS